VIHRFPIALVPIWLFLIWLALGSTSLAESDEQAADRCRRLLESSVVDFYLPACVDNEYGGYLETIDGEGKFVGGEKFLTLQARQLWFFSTLAVADIHRAEALAAAHQGYRFLIEHFHDSQRGGYITKTARDGAPTDRRKHVYPNAFVIYALVEYHRASSDDRPLEQAMELFQTLEAHCYDREHGGYQEFFYEDWRPVQDPGESGYVGAIGTKTYNTHLHLLEAFAQLYRESNDALVARRLAELIQINTVTVKHPLHRCNVDGWLPDWTMIRTPRNLRVSYGHDVECAWLVLDAAEALSLQPALLRSWAQAMCDHAIRWGHDPVHHGFFYTGGLGVESDDRKKEWWTQTEALVAMLTMHRLTGEQRYRDLFEETLDFIETHQIAPDGGWWATLQQDGTVGENKTRTSMWQGAYHNGRALLLCEKLLRETQP
jgi:mannobiose 2-epimerase